MDQMKNEEHKVEPSTMFGEFMDNLSPRSYRETTDQNVNSNVNLIITDDNHDKFTKVTNNVERIVSG